MRTELANKVVSVETEKRLSLKEKMSYGFGDFGNGFMFDLGQIYLLKYFTDVAGIPAAMAGGIFLVSKLFAAITDPIVGSSIDYRKNIGKRGKFRPYLLIGSLVLAVLTVLIFLSPSVSTTGKLIYAYASYMIWGIGYSFVNIPYGSLGAAMTQNSGGLDLHFDVPPNRITWRLVYHECGRDAAARQV